jgi:hypothetical protein
MSDIEKNVSENSPDESEQSISNEDLSKFLHPSRNLLVMI